jgi:hypothetical protein
MSAYGTEFMRLMTIVVAAGLLWPSSGFSQGAGAFADGNRIYNSCSGTDGMEVSYCAGYVAGMTDAVVATGFQERRRDRCSGTQRGAGGDCGPAVRMKPLLDYC